MPWPFRRRQRGERPQPKERPPLTRGEISRTRAETARRRAEANKKIELRNAISREKPFRGNYPAIEAAVEIMRRYLMKGKDIGEAPEGLRGKLTAKQEDALLEIAERFQRAEQ